LLFIKILLFTFKKLNKNRMHLINISISTIILLIINQTAQSNADIITATQTDDTKCIFSKFKSTLKCVS
jgi:hypothetical protein